LRETAKNWKMPPREWTMVKIQFAILFADRLGGD
jgi:transposase-like protein